METPNNTREKGQGKGIFDNNPGTFSRKEFAGITSETHRHCLRIIGAVKGQHKWHGEADIEQPEQHNQVPPASVFGNTGTQMQGWRDAHKKIQVFLQPVVCCGRSNERLEQGA